MSTLDEFDILPDPFANDDDLDWNQILSAPGPLATQASSSPDYFPNDPLDESFLAELDVLENINVSSSAPTVPQSTLPPSGGSTSTVHLSHLFAPPVPPIASSPPRKRARLATEPGILTPSRKANSPSSPTSGSRRKRKKGVDVPRLILAGFEEELTCPICCDIFVATHLLNPCGHSFCGDCAWQWAIKNRKTACPVCRGPLARPAMISNIAMDKMVDVQIQMLTQGHNGEAGWRIGGKMLSEFRQRQKNWKDGAAERNKTVSAVAVPVQPRIWMVVSDDEDDEDFEADEDDEDEEQNDIAFED
ncbi:hypothetical protein B0H16DRAFT_1708185 [Mycena metata]|uniref:RING-type domain-containing protein n=1 Tax=Mycena metata TaxID=1033252 RepID=A0AAD7KJ07_9AGAR|nr:hypothetical protein B0H16DRAFT_1708185 [Mycena metata]